MDMNNGEEDKDNKMPAEGGGDTEATPTTPAAEGGDMDKKPMDGAEGGEAAKE